MKLLYFELLLLFLINVVFIYSQRDFRSNEGNFQRKNKILLQKRSSLLMNNQYSLICDVNKESSSLENMKWNTIPTSKLSNSNNTIEISIQKHNFSTDCPCVYNYDNTCKIFEPLCLATKNNKYCTFRIKNSIITSKGGMIQSNTSHYYSFNDKTMNGHVPNSYNPTVHRKWSDQYSNEALNYLAKNKKKNYSLNSNLKIYDYVVPLRYLSIYLSI
jgi:hypothetical protein